MNVGGLSTCIQKDKDDAAWRDAQPERCANPAAETDCLPLQRYVNSFGKAHYLECERLHSFRGFHWIEAQTKLKEGEPKCDALMVARVVGDCSSPTSYSSCDELADLAALRPSSSDAASWTATLRASASKVEDLTWRAVGEGRSCRSPTTSSSCESLEVYLRRHPGGRHAPAARAILAASASKVQALEESEAIARAAYQQERARWIAVCHAQCKTTCSVWLDASDCIFKCNGNCEAKIR
jgi:hypothetical protein